MDYCDDNKCIAWGTDADLVRTSSRLTGVDLCVLDGMSFSEDKRQNCR